MKIIFSTFALLFLLSAVQADSSCWLSSYSRGFGSKTAGQCRSGLEQNGLYCYPQCQNGWQSSSASCYQPCQSAFLDSGNTCVKLSSYSRGSGFVIWQKSACEKANPKGCEKDGLLWFPICKPGYHASGCCSCSQDCQAGQTDAGPYCVKQSYLRNPDSYACPAGLEFSQGACYKPCAAGYQGFGPGCWSACPAGYTKCGALCVPGQSCSGKVKEIANIALDGVQNLLSNDGPIEKIKKLIDDANRLAGNLITTQFCPI